MQLSQVQITQSSGSKAVDNTVEQACLKAPLLDSPPAAMALPVRVQLTFELKVHGGGFYRQF